MMEEKKIEKDEVKNSPHVRPESRENRNKMEDGKKERSKVI